MARRTAGCQPSVSSPNRRPRGTVFCGWPDAISHSGDDRDTCAGQRRLLHPLELDDGILVVEDGPQLAVAGGRQVALGLHDEEVRRCPELELALLGRQLLLGQLARRARRVDPLLDALDLNRRAGDLRGYLQLELQELGARLPDLQLRPRMGRPLRALAQRVGELELDGPVRVVDAGQVVEGVQVAARKLLDRAAAEDSR